MKKRGVNKVSRIKREDGDSFFFSDEHEDRIMAFDPHYHGLFEIYYLEHGTCEYFIENCLYKVEAGDVVVIPSGVIHRTQYQNHEYSRLLINCSKYFIPSSVLKVLPKITYVYNNKAISERIKELFYSIRDDYNDADSFAAESLRSNMFTLLILMARTPNEKLSVVIQNRYIDAAIEYIQNNFNTDITLSETAKRCSISPEYMSRIFKKETGFRFSEYVTVVRLQHAEVLLKNSGFSIAEIAHQCGFEDSNYFSSIFKKNYGISPRQMRE